VASQITFEIEIQKLVCYVLQVFMCVTIVFCFPSIHNSVSLFKFSYVFNASFVALGFYIEFSFYVLSILCFGLGFLFVVRSFILNHHNIMCQLECSNVICVMCEHQ
jgi:hypothetical protein